MLSANLLSVLITILLLAVCYIFRKWLFRDFNTFISRAALIVYIGGFVVYFIGFRDGIAAIGTRNSWYASIFRPLLSSLEMFAFKNEFVEVGESCKHSMFYMTVYATMHFSAAMVSFAVAINYLGVRFKSSWRLFLLRRKKKLKGDVEVFFGFNDVSVRLAEEIHSIRPDDVIIFITAPEQNGNESMLSIANIFNFFSYRREIMVEVNSLNAILIQIRRPIQNMKGSNVFEQLRLNTILEKTKDYLGFYMIYEDQLQNIAKTLKLCNDDYFREHMKQKAYIFCRATSGKLNGGTAFEYNSKYGVEVVLVDAAQLAAKSLMGMYKQKNGRRLNYQYVSHPVNFVNFDNHTALATSTFHCMIIGFGETGQEIFKFIYEHGQFVYPDDFKGKHMVCHIVDPKANEKRGFFEMRYPCLRKENNLSSLDVEIQWHNHTAGDGRFWELMQNIKDDINYVVIATGSDNRDIAISYDLCDYALRWRKERMHNFGIFVRSYNKFNECRYDELCKVCVNSDGSPVVHTVGKQSESFTLRYMWKNFLEEDAAVFANIFEHSTDKFFNDLYNPDKQEAYKFWWNRHVAVKGEPKDYANVKRIEYQEFSNSLHVYTKMHILGMDNPDNPVGIENKHKLEQCKTVDDLKKLPFFMNIVKMEHKRYVASHESTGYSPMTIDDFYQLGGVDECDVERHKLITLVPWDKLDSIPVASRFHDLIPESQFRHAYKYMFEQLVQAALAIAINQNN